MMLWLPLLLCGTAIVAQAADLPPEVILLQRARSIMARNLQKLPNYTCLQTIERFERSGPRKKPRLLDIVRIEVALVDGKELFSWPGSGRFLDAQISDLVKGGAIGNGIFALHAKAVFQSSVPGFTYAGESVWRDRRTHTWNYEVPQMRSGYLVRVGGREAIVGYHGSIRVDAESLDLLRMEVEADDIPAALQLNSAEAAVEYVRADIGGEKFLLPSFAELEMVGLDGSASENRTRFSACRQYAGESTLIFDDPAPSAATPAQPVRTVSAPANLKIELELQDDVRLENAAIGDPVTAILKKPVALPDGTTIAPGALVHGRLTLFRQAYFGRYSGHAIGLQFLQIEDRSTHVAISVTLEEIQTVRPGLRMTRDLLMGARSGPNGERAASRNVFFVEANVRTLPRRLRMIWRTIEPLPGENP